MIFAHNMRLHVAFAIIKLPLLDGAWAVDLILTEILETPLAELHLLAIPYTHDGFLRLKPVIYDARCQLADYQPREIESAIEDIFDLHDWFFQWQAQEYRALLRAEMAGHGDALVAYIDVDQYIRDQLARLDLACHGDIDILRFILSNFSAISALNELTCVQSHFSNDEFMSVLALLKASNAIVALREHQEGHQTKRSRPVENIASLEDKMLPMLLARAINNSMEALLADKYAAQLRAAVQAPASAGLKDWLTLARRELAQQAVQGKHGAQHQLRKAKAIEWYLEGKFHSRHEAALRLVDRVQDFSKAHGIRLLKIGSESDTIYKWLSAYDKQHD